MAALAEMEACLASAFRQTALLDVRRSEKERPRRLAVASFIRHAEGIPQGDPGAPRAIASRVIQELPATCPADISNSRAFMKCKCSRASQRTYCQEN